MLTQRTREPHPSYSCNVVCVRACVRACSHVHACIILSALAWVNFQNNPVRVVWVFMYALCPNWQSRTPINYASGVGLSIRNREGRVKCVCVCVGGGGGVTTPMIS